MKIKKNGKVITLNESDLKRIVKRTLNEQDSEEKVSGVGNRSLPSCKKVMADLAREDQEKKEKDQKLNKDGSGGRTSIYGIAEEKVKFRKIAGGSPEASILVAYKGGKKWCKCS